MDLFTAQQFNCAAFVLNNNLKNENGNPIEFRMHKFLAQPFMDNTPIQAVIKAGQVGWSTTAIIRAFHLARYLQANIIYTLPSKSIVKDFVIPKVDPLIENNPVIKDMVGDVDSMGLKQIGNGDNARFVYFRSSWDEASGIAISAHILISDELDRSNQKAVRTYKTRLDSAKLDRPDLGWHWMFSNPSIPGYGVDEFWQLSDQKHWFIKCSRCNERQYMSWPESVDQDKGVFICKAARCGGELRQEDRINGHWVKRKLGSEISGYWINQLMVPWHTAKKIIEESHGDQQVFHNFTLGLPYQSKDQSVSRADIMRCIFPDANPKVNNAIGVDNGIIKHYVIGNRFGIFRVGQTESWQEIEDLRNQYNAVMVIDANPYPEPVRKLVQKYRGKVFMNYYEQDKKNLGIIRWGESDAKGVNDKYGVVYSDRTKIIDAVVADLLAQDLVFNMTLTELENADYVYHWLQMFRTSVETEKGIRVQVWNHGEGKPDHFAHATVYFKIALQKTLSHGNVITAPAQPVKATPMAPTIVSNAMEGLNLRDVAKRAAVPRQGGDWRTR